MAVWLRRLVGSSELVSRRQGSKSRRKLKFFPSFFLHLLKLQPPKIVFFSLLAYSHPLSCRKIKWRGTLHQCKSLKKPYNRPSRDVARKWPVISFSYGNTSHVFILVSRTVGSQSEKQAILKTSWKKWNSNRRVVPWPRWEGKVKEGVHRQFTYLRLSIWRLSKYSQNILGSNLGKIWEKQHVCLFQFSVSVSHISLQSSREKDDVETNYFLVDSRNFAKN